MGKRNKRDASLPPTTARAETTPAPAATDAKPALVARQAVPAPSKASRYSPESNHYFAKAHLPPLGNLVPSFKNSANCLVCFFVFQTAGQAFKKSIVVLGDDDLFRICVHNQVSIVRYENCLPELLYAPKNFDEFLDYEFVV